MSTMEARASADERPNRAEVPASTTSSNAKPETAEIGCEESSSPHGETLEEEIDHEAHTTQYEHSDSLVTVRLSEQSKENEAPEVQDVNNTSEKLSPIPDTHLTSEVTGVDETVEHENGDSNLVETSETDSEQRQSKNVSPKEVSPDHLDQSHGVARSSTSTIDAANTSKLDEQSQRSSMSSNTPSLPVAQEAEAETLEAELEQCQNAEKRESLHSRESDNAPLDWAELDKNEQLEQRDEGTDEVC